MKHVSMKLEDGSEIRFISGRPHYKEDFFVAIKIVQKNQIFGVAFDQSSYDEFIFKLNSLEKTKKKRPEYPFFCWAYWSPKKEIPRCLEHGYGFWFRIMGYGIHFTNAAKMFSERNEYEKRFPLPFGWRAKILRKEK